MKTRKNILILSVALVLIVISILLVLMKNGVFSSAGELNSKAFAVQDTSRVTKIFIADMDGNNVLLAKTPKGWMLHDTIPTIAENVNNLLSTLQNITIRQSVAKAAVENVNRMLAVGSVKVEIYEKAPKFSIFGIPFFVKERKTKTYYMGPATQDNQANFAILEGMNEPYVVHLPGFRGFLTPRFSQFESDWRSHTLFNTKITRIKSVEFKDYEKPEESFTTVKNGVRFFDLYNYTNEKIADYDTSKVIDMLSEFRNRNFEYIPSLTPEERDSILQSQPFKTITLTDVDGKKTSLTMYRFMDGEPIGIADKDMVGQIEWEYSRDRFYAILNNNRSEIFMLQYQHFDREIQPLSYFLTKSH